MICAHGMPSPASCLDCMDDNGLGAALVPHEKTDTSHVVSTYPLDCPLCGHTWPAGRRIFHTTRDRWVCLPCGMDLPCEPAASGWERP